MRRGTRRGPVLVGFLVMASMLPFAAPVAAVSTTLVINEVDYDQPSTDTAEFLELKNVGGSAANLSEYTVELVNGTGGGATIYDTIALTGTLAAGDYYVICANNATTSNCDLDVSPNTDLIQNGAPDGMGLRHLGTLVDAVSWEGNTGAPYTEGTGTGVLDDGVSATQSISRCPDGSDTDANNLDFALRPMTPGAGNDCAASALLVINEIDYDQPSTDTSEFLELKNVGTGTANLADFSVELVNGASGGAMVYQTINLAGNGSLAAGDYFVICANNTTTVNCDLDVSPDTNLIQNGAPDAVGLRRLGTLVDAVSYEGDTGAPYTEGTGAGLDDDGVGAADSLSRCPDGVDTNQNNADFKLSPATPGAVNSCPAPAQLVINEVDYDQPSTDTAEFLELKNVGSTTANLADFSVELVNGAGGVANVYLTINPTGTLAAGDYFVICANNVTTVNCDMDVSPNTDLIQNGAPDAIGLRRLGTLVDAVSYEGDTAAPYTEGSGVGLVDTAASATQGLSRCPDGSDTNVNNVDFLLVTNTPGAANSCPTGDGAPEVSTTSPTNGATGVALNGNIEITFSEPVSVTGSWFSIVCADSGAHTATVSGGPLTFTLDPDADFGNVENCTVTVFAANVADQDAADPPDNMNANYVFSFDTAGDVCAASYTPTYSIQGSGTTAAISGTVTTKGVIVGDFEGPTNVGLQGFFIQDVTGDGNAATSDGLFIFRGNTDSGLDVGDVVRVTGTVSEFNSQTQVTATTLVECGTAPLPAAVDVNLPQATSTELERYEGMRVRFPQSLVISEYFEYEQFGEVVLGLPMGGEDRLFTPTAIEEPGSAAYLARASLNQRSQVRLNDGLANSNPTSLRHPDGGVFSLSHYFRGGDKVANAVGVLGERTVPANPFPRYRIEPTGPADFTAVNPRPTSPGSTGGRVTVAAQNTLNFFLTLDTTTNDNGPGPCGGLATLDCRGADADQPQEFDRQRDKLLAVLAGINADVIGLNEIENTPGVDPLGDATRGIVPGLNSLLGAGTYAAINTGVIGTDAIRVGMIYKPGVVTPVGDFAILDTSVDPRFLDNRNRPALAQTFEEKATGARFTVVINHFKSKGSDCNSNGDPDTGDGSGNCNGVRTLAAQALVDWLADDPTGSGDTDFLIVGDLNSYAMEDPIDAIKVGSNDVVGGGDDYTNLVAQYKGTYAYSYVFDAQAGYLDHALSSSTLTSQVTGVEEWHNNADEADVFDYDTTFKPPTIDALYEPLPYRSSDHDAIIVGLDLDAAPVITSLTGPASVAVGASGAFEAEWTDLNANETFTTTWDWGDGSSDTVHSPATSPDAASHAYAAAGFYTVTFTVTDSTGLSDSGTLLVAVTDPAAGKVTGSGTYAGGGSFSLSAKYHPSGTSITGTSSFSAPGVTFVTGTVDWLVVSGNRGTYAGTGTYNGNAGYHFLICVSDGGSPGSKDRVRFQVSDADGNVVYDTQPGAPVDAAPTTTPTGGNVTVHN